MGFSATMVESLIVITQVTLDTNINENLEGMEDHRFCDSVLLNIWIMTV